MASLDLKFDVLENIADETAAPKFTKAQGSWLKSIKGRSRKLTSSPPQSNTTKLPDKELAIILRDYLQTTSTSENAMEDVAQSILALLPPSAPYSKETFLLAHLCIDAAEQIPYYHHSQVKLARLLHYLAGSLKLMSKEVKQGNEEFHYSQQAMKEVVRDNYLGPQTEELSPMAWVNYHAFLAHLESKSLWRDDPMYAVWAMRDAFEEPPDEVWEKDYSVMAAAQWILWNGQNLFHHVLYPMCSDEISWRFGSLYTKGGALLSIDRWCFWRDSFAAIAENDKSSDECKKLSLKAVKLMDAMQENMML